MDDMTGPTQPLERASTLAARAYVDAEILAQEQQRIFPRHWQFACHESQLDRVGASLFVDIAGVRLVLVRTVAGIGAYEAVCRHRAGPLDACRSGGQDFFRCRYHGWSYDLEGRLMAATEMQGCEDFDPSSIALPRVESAVFDGLVFVRRSVGPAEFSALMAGIGDRLVLSGHGLSRLQHHATVSYEIDCNWKTYVDNFLEGYHVPLVHPSLNEILDYRSYRTELAPWYSLQSSPLDSAPTAYGSGEALYYFIYPATMLNILPDRLQTNRVIPLAPERCRVVFDFFYPAEWSSAERSAKFASDSEFSERVQQEDIAICVDVQRNLASGSYVSGRFNPRREQGLHHFQRLWLGDVS